MNGPALFLAALLFGVSALGAVGVLATRNGLRRFFLEFALATAAIGLAAATFSVVVRA